MPQKKRRPAVRRAQTRPTGIRTLLVIDNEPIRRGILREYHSVEKSLGRLREELEGFETRDLPAYHRWESVTFGALLTEIREMEFQATEKHHLLMEVEEESFWENCSMVTAYRRVMARRENPADPDDEEDEPFSGRGPDETEPAGEKMFGDSDLPPGFDFAEYDRMSAAAKKKARASYENLAAMFEAFTGNPAPDFDEVLRRERPGGHREDPLPERARPAQAPAPDPTADRLKTLYRQMVRKLHPDTNPNQGWRERELWHDVQAAYQAGDLDRLEAVAGRCEIGLHGVSGDVPVRFLLRLIHDLRTALRGLRKQAREVRGHSAWNFSQRQIHLPALEKTRRRILEKSRAVAAAELARLTRALDQLAEASARSPARRPARKRHLPRESCFDQGELF